MGKGWSAMSHTILMATENSDWESLRPVVQRTDGWEGSLRSGKMGQRFYLSLFKGLACRLGNLIQRQFILDVTGECLKIHLKLEKYIISLAAGYIKIMATKKIVVFNDQI